MKKFNRIAVFVLLLVCLFSLAACAENAHYVEGSLTYQAYFDSSIYTYFSFEFPEEGNYQMSYTVEYYYDGTKFDEQTVKKMVTVKDEKIVQMSAYFYDNNVSFADVNSVGVEITNVKITKSNPFDGLAIGFGVTGGALLIGAVVLFVVLKKRESK